MALFSGNLSLELDSPEHTKTGYGALMSETFLVPRRLEKHNCFEVKEREEEKTL